MASIGDTIGGFFGIGDAFNNSFNANAQQAANEANYQRFLENREYETNLANTAYQRAVVDMKKAGINPALAGSVGGASVPSSAASYATAPSNSGSGVFTGLGSLIQQLYRTGLDYSVAKSRDNLNIKIYK